MHLSVGSAEKCFCATYQQRQPTLAREGEGSRTGYCRKLSGSQMESEAEEASVAFRDQDALAVHV